MSGASETFPCPWCGMTYPARPVLVGKVVRCKGCRNAFILQANGTATKAAAEAVPATAASTPATPPPEAAPVLTKTPPPNASSRLRTPRPGTERSIRKKSEQLESARAKMAAELAAVATKAANSEVAKREERRSERLTKVGATGNAVEDAKRSKHTAILTGEGDRRQREYLLWTMGSLAVVGVIALCVVALTVRSASRAALDAYTAEVPMALNRYPEMGAAIQARAWLISSPGQMSGPQIATDLSDASFGSERSLDLTQLATRFAELKGLRLAEDLGWWVAPADRAKLTAAFAGRPVGERLRIAVVHHIQALDHAAWLKKLELPEEDRRVVVDLITGRPSPDGIDFAKRMLDAGDIPERARIREFHGKRGEMRIDAGPPRYILKTQPYRGTLARFDGVGWSTGWRVLELQITR